MPICSNSKFDWSYLDKVTPGISQQADEATSPTLAAVIRDIEQLYLLLSDGTTDGQTGSPLNAGQETGEGDPTTTTTTTTGGGVPEGYSEIVLDVCVGGVAAQISVIGKML